jgi:hypothetical protein
MQLDPGWPERAANQAWRIATGEDRADSIPEKPLQLAKQACQATDPATPPQYLDALAAAYANAGQFDRAATMARRALAALTESEDRGYAEQIRLRLAAYEAGRPDRELAPGGP